MACILRAPSADGRGVVVFTTPERDNVINADPAVRTAVERLKPRWAIGLHHHWHDWDFQYDPLFDFSLAGEDDLRERSGRPVPLVPLDACNFVPPMFRAGRGERFWDVLYVARAVGFKRMPEFLQSIRSLYDAGHRLRVLCISPMPPYDPAEAATVFYALREQYEQMFSGDEQGTFTLLDLSSRYPFPFDLETLAFLYRSSRVFVHFADDERRCRVAAYAWASGLPVVAMEAVSSLLPAELRREPYYFGVEDYGRFPARIVDAVGSTYEEQDFGPVDAYFAPDEARSRFVRLLAELLGDPGLTAESLALGRLDIRLGRHHGIGIGPNNLPQGLGDFVALLLGDEGAVRAALELEDPEQALAAGARPGLARRVQGWVRRSVA